MFQKKQVNPRQKVAARSYPFQPPVRGIVLNEPLANAKPGGARVLENWLPTVQGARTRGGSLKVATISGYTFSRASTATYRDTSGVVATAQIDEIRWQDGAFLLEDAATNLFTRSEEFDNAAWTKSNTTVTANATAAPDGTNTADKWNENTTTQTQFNFSQSGKPITAEQPVTTSYFLKAAERNTARLRFATNIGFVADAIFDLSAGTVALESQNTLSTEMEDWGDGWYRCSLTALAQPGATQTAGSCLHIYLDVDTPTYDGVAGSGLYVWGAQIEDNALAATSYIPTSGSTVTRAADSYAVATPEPVRRMWKFKSGQADELFASTVSEIFNITSVDNPNVIPVPVVSGQNAGYYSTAQIGTAGGNNYLYAVNGADDALLYDGSSYVAINAASTPAITGVATSDLSFVWTFASRLFFVKKNTMSAWYLPVDSIGGAAAEFSLAGVFQEGGSLLFGGKWSLDSGDGLDDKCVFVSTEGEVAVFQGTNPGSASDWQKVGVYKITAPVGPNATMQAGGDLLMAVADGIVPITQAVNKDSAALSLSAVTRSIEPEWKRQVPLRASLPWEIMKWPTNNLMIVSLPAADDSIPTLCYAANLQTGAWGFITGWDTQCMALFGTSGFFGTRNGTIHQMDVTGSDDGVPFTCTYVALPDQMKSPGAFKTVMSMRATFNANIPFKPKISASMNYKVKLPTAPPSAPNIGQDLWDQGIWDVSVWDAGTVSDIFTRWVSIGSSGFAVSPQIQITSGTSIKLEAELIQMDVLYQQGEVMV